ncbi:aminotransferase class IV family protein [Cognatishimia activa]|uniref:Probable branched-chain-amino-acid aminotransferase n=1 Tax=Cognatishimia activa TaxID=1715691 RepID=A0A0P1ISJ8_9RHOB|nr:aminotransferase class IV family protein [Cognatishimia activa]CUI66606.1 4-amino-4-deoxychorismate lyase [Cognatishimia activa]CUK26453.1 4-amino-4-deoxychorismate lyase [Cognatishimia activa]
MESTLRGSVPAGTRLIETYGWWHDTGFKRLDLHLARMERSARQLGFGFDAAAAHQCMKTQGDAPLRCRLTLGEDGFEFTATPMAENPASWTVAIADQRLSSNDIWLQHKTTQRALYDAARANSPEGIDELIFLNERNELCEGTITNLFVTLKDGQMVTPPIHSGVLPGILRQTLIESGQAREMIITRDHLQTAHAIHVGNALRGLIPAVLA